MGFTYSLCRSLASYTAHTMFSLRIIGRENMLQEGPALLAMNHQSFFDPPLAAICSERQIHFLARKSLFSIPFLGRLLKRLNVIGVDRAGTDMSALKAVVRILKSGGSTIIFPEGTRTHDGHIQTGQAGIGLVVAKSLAPVIPMRVFGAFHAFPRTAKIPRRAPIAIVIGRPLDFSKEDTIGDAREVYQRISDRVMLAISALELPPE